MKFIDVIGGWMNRHFANEEAIFLVVMLVIGFLVMMTLGTYLAPVLTGLVLAFVLEGLVRRLEQYKVPRLVAVVARTFGPTRKNGPGLIGFVNVVAAAEVGVVRHRDMRRAVEASGGASAA